MDKILVIDYGSQYNALIVRRIKDLGVYSFLKSCDITYEEIIKISGLRGIILSGGPQSVNERNHFSLDERILHLDIPVLGICYGMQLIVHLLNGNVVSDGNREYGNTLCSFDTSCDLFGGLTRQSVVYMSHSDTVETLPKGFKTIASSENIVNAGIRGNKIYGIQFHPEVTNTVEGQQILSNFIYKICGAVKSWSLEDFISEKIAEIRNRTAGQKVLLGISGGVDSAVAALLIHKAIGDKLTCLFIDHGLLRKDEAELVRLSFSERLKINVSFIDASELFLADLKGVTDPEQKRKIIGRDFIEVFRKAAKDLGPFGFLAQGTLYTDKVESGKGGSSSVIKSHHNVGGLPKELGFSLLEPLDELYKDEVREVGRRLGLDEAFVARQPFPGPGLAIRIIGEVTKEKLAVLKKADAIFREEVAKAGLSSEIWQYFCVLTADKTVGVMGDNRTYMYTLALRAITSKDGMTADFYHFDMEFLSKVSTRIINQTDGINRVVYDITSKPPATIEWE